VSGHRGKTDKIPGIFLPISPRIDRFKNCGISLCYQIDMLLFTIMVTIESKKQQIGFRIGPGYYRKIKEL
jgi:hypothetical protein